MSKATEDCVENHLSKFNRYDTEVDVISSIETYLNGVYKSKCKQYHFDRYPNLSPTGTDKIRPHFVACFERDYSLIGLLVSKRKESYSNASQVIETLQRLDRISQIPLSENDTCDPSTLDILLLVPGSLATNLGNSLSKSINEDFSLSKNIVLVRYEFNSETDPPTYQFNRELAMQDEFRDEVLPRSDSLSQNIGELGGYKGIDVSPRQFRRKKKVHPINNDRPPIAYLATQLWDKVFPDDLEDEQFLDWRRGNMNAVIDLPAYNVSDIQEKVNREYIRSANVKSEWMEETLDFLCSCGRADKKNGDYIIKFTGVIPDERPNESTSNEDDISARAERFIYLYCDEETEDIQSEYKTLDSFV